MFIAEFLICAASGKCLVIQETKPVLFQTEQVCLDHAEAMLPELTKKTGYRVAVVRCVPIDNKLT